MKHVLLITALGVAAQSCKTSDGTGLKTQPPAEAAGANAQARVLPDGVFPGTDEATKYFPPLDQEFPHRAEDAAAESDYLKEVERNEEDETLGHLAIIDQIQSQQRSRHTPPSETALRGFHAKDHGCLFGQLFVVDKPQVPAGIQMPSNLGIFGDRYQGIPQSVAGFPKSYPVLVRYSNAQGMRQSDRSPDGKGMGIKVVLPDGKDQDFTMSDTPTCNSRTAARFMAFGLATAGVRPELQLSSDADALQTKAVQDDITKTFKSEIFTAAKQTLRDLATQARDGAESFRNQKVPPAFDFLVNDDLDDTRNAIVELVRSSFTNVNPAAIQYWSRTPYRLGDDRDGKAVKFTAIPRRCCERGSGFEVLAGCSGETPARPQLPAPVREALERLGSVVGNVEAFIQRYQSGTLSRAANFAIRGLPANVRTQLNDYRSQLQAYETAVSEQAKRLSARSAEWRGTFSKVVNAAAGARERIHDQITRYSSVDGFRKNLTESAQEAICYDFALQFQTDPRTMPTENPTVDWNSQPVTFAKLVMPAQNFNEDEQRRICERAQWAPGNFVPEHRPMGHMNRIRIAVYDQSMKRRTNGQKADARDFPLSVLDR